MPETPNKDDLTVVYSAFNNKRFLKEAINNFNSNFLDDRLKMFFATVVQFYKDPAIKDVLSLPSYLSELDKKGITDEQKKKFTRLYRYFDEEYAKQFGTPKPGDVKLAIKNIRDRENNAVLKAMANDILSRIENSSAVEEINRINREALRKIQRIQHLNVFDEGSFAADVDNMFLEMEAVNANADAFRGVLSGYECLDSLTTGFHPGELHIICGMEGSGKSTTMMNFGINGWMGKNKIGMKEFNDSGVSVLYFSLEMPRSNQGSFTQGSYLNKRILSCMAEVDLARIRKGTLSKDEYNRLLKARDFAKEYAQFGKHLYVVDMPRGASVASIEAKFLEIQDEIGPIGEVVIDYLGLMCAEDAESDAVEQREVAEGVHEMMRVNRVAGLSAAQMKRPEGKNGSLDNQKYNVTRIARTSEIGRNANNVYMIQTGDNFMETELLLHVVKARDGEQKILPFRKAFNCMKLYEGSALNPQDPAVNAFESFT